MEINKRKKKRMYAWWKGLELHERADHMSLFHPKSKIRHYVASEEEIEKMYNWIE
jgi:hypothetical protein